MPDRPYPATTTGASLARFHDLRVQASALLVEASRLPALPLLYVSQAEAAAGIAGIELHRVHGQGGAEDALALRDDVEVLIRKVDPLIAAVGAEAVENFRLDPDLFAGRLENALDDATAALSEAAADSRDSQEDTEAEHAREFERAEA